MGAINRDGPAPIDLSEPAAVDPAELRRLIEAGEWVVDLRNRAAFAAGHLSGSIGFELSDSFVTYLGWLYVWAPLTLIGEDSAQIAAAKRELVRIGVDHVRGAASGAIDKLAGTSPLRSYRVADFATLAVEIDRDTVTILDVRRDDEFQESHLPKAVNIPVHELSGRLNELPAGEVWCIAPAGTGHPSQRSDSVAVLVDDEFTTAETLGLMH